MQLFGTCMRCASITVSGFTKQDFYVLAVLDPSGVNETIIEYIRVAMVGWSVGRSLEWLVLLFSLLSDMWAKLFVDHPPILLIADNISL